MISILCGIFLPDVSGEMSIKPPPPPEGRLQLHRHCCDDQLAPSEQNGIAIKDADRSREIPLASLVIYPTF